MPTDARRPILFRTHRTTWEESMETARPVADFGALMAELHRDFEGWPDAGDLVPEAVSVTRYRAGDSEGWYTHQVSVHGVAAGFLSAPLQLGQENT